MATQARSIASLTISFGLVAIPVKLYSATVSSERISFNLLRQKDGSRVKQQYVAVADGEPVERSEMVKGYEFAKDQYVMFTPEELKALEDTTTHAIDIGQFVPLASVDPVYFDGTYYLAPDKGVRNRTRCWQPHFAKPDNARSDAGSPAARSTS